MKSLSAWAEIRPVLIWPLSPCWDRSNSFFHSFPQIHYFSFVHIIHEQSDCSRLNFTTASGYGQSGGIPDRRSYRSAWWCNLSLVWIPSGSTRRATKDLKEEELPFERQELGLARVSPWSQLGFRAVRLVQSVPSFLQHLDPVYVPEHILNSPVAMKRWAGSEDAAPGGGVQPQSWLLGPHLGNSDRRDGLVCHHWAVNTSSFVCFFLIQWYFCVPGCCRGWSFCCQFIWRLRLFAESASMNKP